MWTVGRDSRRCGRATASHDRQAYRRRSRREDAADCDVGAPTLRQSRGTASVRAGHGSVPRDVQRGPTVPSGSRQPAPYTWRPVTLPSADVPPPREDPHGPAAGVRPPHDRGARHPVRPAVVHRRARHPQVRGRRAGRARGRLRRGHRLRRLGDRGPRARLRVGHARPARPDAPSRSCPGAADRPRHRPDVLRHHDCPTAQPPLADPRHVLKRAPRPRPPSTASPSTRTPRSSSTCSSDEPEPRRRARAGRPRPATSTTSRAAPRTTSGAAAITDARETWASRVEFSHHEGGPGQNEIDLRYADALTHGRQHHDVPHRHQGGRARAGRLRHLHAQAVHRPPRLGHAHPPVALRGRPQRLPRGRRRVPAVARSAGSSSPACCAHAREITAVTNQWVNSYKRLLGRRRGAALRLLGPQQPLGAGAACRCTSRARASRPGSSTARSTPRCNPYLAFAVLLAAGLQGHRGGLRAARRGRGRRLGADRRRAPGAGHTSRCPTSLAEAIAVMEEQRAGRRDARRARLRLLPAQQAGRSGPTTASR